MTKKCCGIIHRSPTNMKFLLIAAFLGIASAKPQLQSVNAWYHDCGRSKYSNAGDPFIINGKNARQGELPWQVSLRGSSGSSGSAFCGGTIISPNWVVTAAHCTEGSDAGSITVVVGEHDIREDNNFRIVHRVSKIVDHPDYNRFNLNQDISLLKMEIPISFNENVGAACAPDAEASYGESRSQVAGWGNMRDDGWYQPANILQWTDVEVISTSECKQAMWGITEYMICAADFAEKRDSCQGDSGGPLTLKDSNDLFRLVGVVSWGYGCASDTPGVYTKVQQYVSWVADTMKNN